MIKLNLKALIKKNTLFRNTDFNISKYVLCVKIVFK